MNTERAFEVANDLEVVDELMDRVDKSTTPIARRALLKSQKLGNVQREDVKDKIRLIASMELSGMSNREIGDHFKVTPAYITKYRHRYMEAFEDARKVLLAESSRQYHLNLMRVKAALSNAGPKAVDVLSKLMSDAEVSSGMRIKAAMAVLKLLGAAEERVSEAELSQHFVEYMDTALSTPETLNVIDITDVCEVVQ